MKVIVFESSAGSYDRTQCDDDIDDGDVLAIPSEGIFGFLLSAWPVAISAESGEFHFITSHEHFLANSEHAAYFEAYDKAHELYAAWAKEGT